MEEVTFERQYRTPYSEGYLLLEGDDRLGRAELHYSSPIVYCTLLVERELEEESLMDLIDQIDDEIVRTSSVPRDDFVVTVFQGREVGVYGDEYFDQEDDEEPGISR
ncbi:MAG: hypothetical protein HY329_20480 [Chloroflexi bacterium]|nr:hypothetical protein [Chloroflexota bacterium]